jgi:phenylpyruvate tautomerase PptA (4-oxalocrotonate tautomerase family)
MAQIKIYGMRAQLDPIKARLSDVVHSCVVDALQFPRDKRAHRFFPMAPDDFYLPSGRTDAYTIIEIAMIEGRTTETKKKLIMLLFERISSSLGISTTDLEIAILEAPKASWGFRGKTGDEVELTYEIQV